MPDKIITIDDNTVDDHVDEKIKECIRDKKNFFMFAGAGSGKTRSLVNALNFIAEEYGLSLNLQHKQVAIITYTNAACDEILRRVGYNPLFAASTIHSFLWELIKPYQRDIKTWVKSKMKADIVELQQKQVKARTRDYSTDIAKKQDRLTALENISRFTYNPNGENVGRDSLNHAEVIDIGSTFISERATMQKIMISKFPILFIDESQDTKKELIDALWKVESSHIDDFTIGMFGDTMQRIYMDGKENLNNIVPENWERPAKVMNHRSTKRVIQLANAIRKTIDGQQQQARLEKSDGFVRLFIVPNTADKDMVESQIYAKMAEITGDAKWSESNARKTLVLEHSMAANRLGFRALDDNLKVFDQSFRDGTLVELYFLMKNIYPLIEAKRSDNRFAVMKILREHSLLFKKNNIIAVIDQPLFFQTVSEKVNSLSALWDNKSVPTCIEVYKTLREIALFELPKRIDEVLSDETEVNERIAALREGLNVPFSELINYWEYINGNTQFSTHQGIKGLEFDRVSVIMDDETAGGFLFSYEKLFGAKSLTDTDRRNQAEGKDSSITRTMRLFYVTCTRAKESLALIAYTNDMGAVKKTALSNNWFSEDEIVLI
jgi:DNA helicase-2/ATP-dependent DNA helicase PcrA